MSHVVTVAIEMKNKQVLEAALETLPGVKILGEGTHKLFSGQTANGLGFTLPGWKFPVVVNTETGKAQYDNYNGSWGKQEALDEVVQKYAVGLCRLQAQQQGKTVEEETLENGDVRLRVYDYAAG